MNYQKKILKIFISVFILFVLVNCTENLTNSTSIQKNDSQVFQKPPVPLPDIEVILDRYLDYYFPGENTGWISYIPGDNDYTLKFELIRDFIVGTGGGGGTEYSARIIVKDKFNNILLDEWIDLEVPNERIINRTFSPSFGSHSVMIQAPEDLIDALGAKITLLRNSTF